MRQHFIILFYIKSINIMKYNPKASLEQTFCKHFELFDNPKQFWKIKIMNLDYN